MQDLSKVKRGINLILASIVLALLLIFTLAIGITVLRGQAVAVVGLSTIGFFAVGLLGLAGRIFCLATPVGKGFVQGALVCDVLAFLLALLTDSQGGLLGLASSVLFLIFLYKLARHLNSQEVVSTILGIGKTLAVGILIMVGSAVGATFEPMFGMFMLVGAIVSLYSGLLYVRALSQTGHALANHGLDQGGGSL